MKITKHDREAEDTEDTTLQEFDPGIRKALFKMTEAKERGVSAQGVRQAALLVLDWFQWLHDHRGAGHIDVDATASCKAAASAYIAAFHAVNIQGVLGYSIVRGRSCCASAVEDILAAMRLLRMPLTPELRDILDLYTGRLR